MLILSVFRPLASKLATYQQRYLTRKALKSLDASALKDIGISRADALCEAQKPFWKA
jgi:uncharacterized protein YjiS (DUF1127 family)